MTRRLHIGGREVKEGWEIIDALEREEVDHIGNANDLTQFADCTFKELYASHVVEHFDYRDELDQTLREWWRVLEPDGTLYVSVPDMDILASAILAREKLDIGERFHAMQMLFGGHVDKYDYHQVGLTDEFLAMYLGRAGFGRVRRVKELGIFRDTSYAQLKGIMISLNLVAQKPADGKLPETARKDVRTPNS